MQPKPHWRKAYQQAYPQSVVNYLTTHEYKRNELLEAPADYSPCHNCASSLDVVNISSSR
jgi:hypothetical protein